MDTHTVGTVHAARYDKLMAAMGDLGADLPGHMQGFMTLHHAVATEGALDVKTKELMALAIGIAVRCAGCITCHVKDSLDAGATRAEIIEVIGVAIMMGGGPSVVYGAEAREALEEFLA